MIVSWRFRGLGANRNMDGSLDFFSLRGSNSIGRRCDISVYWNGVRTSGLDIPKEFIGGIEFYNPGSIPVEYQDLGSGCGVLLLWPRP
jgi:hypothetical protein